MGGPGEPKLHPAASERCYVLSQNTFLLQNWCGRVFLHGCCCLMHWFCFDRFDTFLSVKVYGINVPALADERVMEDSWGDYPLRSWGQQSSDSQDHGKLHEASWQFLSPLLLWKSSNSPFIILSEKIFFLKTLILHLISFFCHRSGKVWKWKIFWIITFVFKKSG